LIIDNYQLDPVFEGLRSRNRVFHTRYLVPRRRLSTETRFLNGLTISGCAKTIRAADRISGFTQTLT